MAAPVVDDVLAIAVLDRQAIAAMPGAVLAAVARVAVVAVGVAARPVATVLAPVVAAITIAITIVAVVRLGEGDAAARGERERGESGNDSFRCVHG